METKLNLSKYIRSLNKTAKNHLPLKQVDHLIESVLLCQQIFKEKKEIGIWLDSPNYNFGGASPLSLILINRGNKVVKFLEAHIAGY